MWAPGRSDRVLGFTLVEVLVVVVLIAIATAASLTMLRPPVADALQQGRQLAVLLERLALEARLSGRPTSWRCEGPQKIIFEMLDRDAGREASWKPWEVKAGFVLPDGVRADSFVRESGVMKCTERTLLPVFGLAADFSFELSDTAGQRRRLVSDAFGRVVLQTEASP